MQMIETFLTWLRRIERAVAMTLLFAIFAVVFLATVMRLLHRPFTWDLEVTQAMFVWLCVLAADVTLQNFGHFSVSGLADLLPRRARLALETFNSLLVLALLAFLTWYGTVFADMSSGRPLPMLDISEGVATFALPTGFALMCITVIEQLVRRRTNPHEELTHAARDIM